MPLDLQNTKEVQAYLKRESVKIEKALVYSLEYFATELENHAKENGEYQDQTSNLRNSKGSVLLKDREPITYAGLSSGTDGDKAGMEFLNSLIPSAPMGFVVLVVAGMEYAAYVEDIYNLNVLQKTKLKAVKEMPELIKKIIRKYENI